MNPRSQALKWTCQVIFLLVGYAFMWNHVFNTTKLDDCQMTAWVSVILELCELEVTRQHSNVCKKQHNASIHSGEWHCTIGMSVEHLIHHHTMASKNRYYWTENHLWILFGLILLPLETTGAQRKCTYSFTVSGRDAQICGHRGNQVPYPLASASPNAIDQSKLLETVSKLLDKQAGLDGGKEMDTSIKVTIFKIT